MKGSAAPSRASGAQIQHLERRRREMAAEYAKAARKHLKRADLSRALVRATCAALRAEVQVAAHDARIEAKKRLAPGMPDLFGEAA